MNFADALKDLADGKRARRDGWNGKRQWVCWMPPTVIPSDLVNGRTRRFVPSGHLNVGGYFVMWTENDVWQPGWLASQADLVADDWVVLDDP